MRTWMVITLACVSAHVADAAPEIVVSPSGPVKTLRAALDESRKLPADRPRRIVVHDGEYLVAEPLVLDARDSHLTLEAAADEKVTLYGGQRITGWQRDGDHLWSAPIPAVNGTPMDFRMLAVNDRFCQRARLPKEGTFTHLTNFDVPWMSTTGGGWKRKPTQEELTTLRYRPEDLGAWLDTKNAELTVYHMWDESVVGIARLDPATQTITFSNPAGHPPGAFNVHKYTVWNVREGMTRPGQWYLDRTAGKVVYWPLPGEDMAKASVFAPTTESIIHLAGTAEAPVTGVTIRGLRLSVTNTPLKAGGFGASAFAGAVEAGYAHDCRLLDLRIFRVGGQGIRSGECSNLRIEGCEISETGACGLKASGEGTVISDNRIHHVGVTYPSAIGLWCDGTHCLISHNEIHDTTYSAIALGGEDDTIENNLISRAMQELHDGAAIYITFCKRITVRGNWVRDIVDTGGYGASAYYLDEQAEDCIVEGNVSETTGWPSHNHMAKRNVLRNNIWLCPAEAKLTFPRSTDYALERNVIVAKGKISFSNPPAIATWRDNILFNGGGVIEGAPADVLQVDPQVVSPANGVFRFGPESPARKLGIEPFDVSGAGPRPPEKRH